MYGEAAPDGLKRFWRVQTYGDPWGSGWMNWPAGWLNEMSILSNVYQAHQSMVRAGAKRVPWRERNPEMARITDAVFQLRKEMKRRGDG